VITPFTYVHSVDINSVLGQLYRVNEGSVSEVDAASIFTVEMCNLSDLQCMQLYIWLCFVMPVVFPCASWP
jgi:hypothetical protein